MKRHWPFQPILVTPHGFYVIFSIAYLKRYAKVKGNIAVKFLSSSRLLSQVFWQTKVSKLNLKFIEKCGMKHIRSYTKSELSDSREIEMRLQRYAAFAVYCLSLLCTGGQSHKGGGAIIMVVVIVLGKLYTRRSSGYLFQVKEFFKVHNFKNFIKWEILVFSKEFIFNNWLMFTENCRIFTCNITRLWSFCRLNDLYRVYQQLFIFLHSDHR